MRLVNFALLLIALVLFALFWLVGILFTIGYSIRLGSWQKMVGYWSQSALATALAIDILGNVVCRDFLNWAAIKGPDRYDFGGFGQTISYVLGRNKATGSLTDAGRGLATLLNFIDPGHVERAVENYNKRD